MIVGTGNEYNITAIEESPKSSEVNYNSIIMCQSCL